MNRTVEDLRPSFYWSTALVIILSCGHRHVRPRSFDINIGDEFDCCFCDEEAA